MNGGDDPSGLDLPFRQSGLNFIKTSLKDYYTRSSNDPACLRSLDEIANKFEHKVFVNATSRDDYIKIIEQKLTQATNMRPASSVTGNQLEGSVIPRPVVQSGSAKLNFNQNPNIPVMQPRNMGVQNRQFGQHNQQLQYTRSLIDPQGPISKYPDCSLKGDKTPSAYVCSQNNFAASALSSISDSRTTNPDIIVQFRRAKLSYLPELEKWLKNMEGQFSQAKTISGCDSLKKHVVSVRQMIRMLSIAENQLMLLNKQKLRHNMNIVMEYYNKFVKNGISFAMNQAHQFSCTNVTQNTQTSPIVMNQSVISSSTTNPEFSSGSSTEPMDMKSNTVTNLVTHSVSQQEKRKHPIDLASVPNMNDGKQSTNVTSRTSKKPRSKPREKSSGNSHESWLNLANLRSKRSSIPAKFSQSSTPSTHMTPSCGKTAEIETVKEASNSQEQLILEDSVSILGAPEILSGSPMLSDNIENQSINCLLDAANLASNENGDRDPVGPESLSTLQENLYSIAGRHWTYIFF